ncbi:MAG: ribokinase [Chloroflexota bacterium]|nr:MAG: ribokinase [Chloroflexota bacterium]
MSAPDFLAIGHLTIDLVARRRQLGGAALYAALAASRLGMQTALVTSGAPAELILLSRFPLSVASQPAAQTTTFRNAYKDQSRRQRLLARAAPIVPANIPVQWAVARIVYLAPVAGELGPELLHLFPASLRGIGMQGWMRSWDEHGKIHGIPLPAAGAELTAAAVAFVSAEDLDGAVDLIDRYACHTPCLVVTRGAEGADLYLNGQKHTSPAFSATSVDPTGAGDVFAAAFLVQLSQGADPLVAARFANCAASFVVERRGLAGVPTLDQIQSRLHA